MFSVSSFFPFLGIVAAAYDLEIEFLVVKGVSDLTGGSPTPDMSWKSFASVMAASVVFHMLNDPFVFECWPHYSGMRHLLL